MNCSINRVKIRIRTKIFWPLSLWVCSRKGTSCSLQFISKVPTSFLRVHSLINLYLRYLYPPLQNLSRLRTSFFSKLNEKVQVSTYICNFKQSCLGLNTVGYLASAVASYSWGAGLSFLGSWKCSAIHDFASLRKEVWSQKWSWQVWVETSTKRSHWSSEHHILLFIQSQNQRIPEWFGLEGNFEIIEFHTPAMGIFH